MEPDRGEVLPDLAPAEAAVLSEAAPPAQLASPATDAAGAAPASPPILDAADSETTIEMAHTLSAEVDLLYAQMTREMGGRREPFDAVADLLQKARAALLRGPAGVAEAEKLVRQAQGLLRLKEDQRRWAASYGAGILGYEMLFFLCFAGLLAFDRPLAAWVGVLTNVAGAMSMRDILPFWDPMIWGGIGGVLGALYSLHWHVAELQDFDRQYNMWYVVQPIMGAMLGALIYALFLAGLLALRSPIPPASAWLPSALACLAAFRQKFILELLDKLVEILGLRPLWNRSQKS